MAASTSVMDLGLGLVGNDDTTEPLVYHEGVPCKDTGKRRRRTGVVRDPSKTLDSMSLGERRTGGRKEGFVLSLGRIMNPPGAIPEDDERRAISSRGQAAGNALRENPFSSLSLHSMEEKEFGPITVTLQRPDKEAPQNMDQLELPVSGYGYAHSSSGGSASSAQQLLKPPQVSRPEAVQSSFLDARPPLGRCNSEPDPAELCERLDALKRVQDGGEPQPEAMRPADHNRRTSLENRMLSSGAPQAHGARHSNPESGRRSLGQLVQNSESLPCTPPGYLPNPTCTSDSSTPDRTSSVKSYQFGHMLGSQGIIMVDPPPPASGPPEYPGETPLAAGMEQEMLSLPSTPRSTRERRDSEDADTESIVSGRKARGVTVRLSSYFNRSTRASIKSVISGKHSLACDKESGEQKKQPAPLLMQEYIRGYATRDAVNPLLKAAQKKGSQPVSQQERKRRLAQLNRLQSIELDKLSYESQQEAESDVWRQGMQHRVEQQQQHRCRDRHRTVVIVIIAAFVLMCLVVIPPLAATKWKSHGAKDLKDPYHMAMPEGSDGSCPGKSYRGGCFVLISGLPEPWLIAHQVCYRLGGDMAMLSQQLEKENKEYLNTLCGLVAEASESAEFWIDQTMYMDQDLDGGDLNLVNSPASWNSWWDPDPQGDSHLPNIKCTTISMNSNATDAFTVNIGDDTVYVYDQDCKARRQVICRF